MVVFDFDKTLTYKDTLFGFYKEADGKNILFSFKRILLIFFAILLKVRLINNDQLKKIGISLFLRGKSKNEIHHIANQYVQKIELNKIYENIFLKVPKKERLIVTASFEEYLSLLFPTENIIGSKLSYDESKILGLGRNMYNEQKKNELLRLGISSIDFLYTDSDTDKPLMDLAKRVFIVQGDQIKEKLI